MSRGTRVMPGDVVPFIPTDDTRGAVLSDGRLAHAPSIHPQPMVQDHTNGSPT